MTSFDPEVSSSNESSSTNETSLTNETSWATRMAAAQSGDGAVYQELLRDCVPVIANIARRQGVRGALVDDVVQEVLLTLHRARQTYDPARPFLAWLTTIAQRRAIDALRRGSRQMRREVDAPAAYEAWPDPQAGAAEVWERGGRTRGLSEAIATLPAGQRQAIELIALQERSLEEAAAVTGRTKTALKVNFHRALKSLRLRLGDGTPGDKESGGG